MSKYNIAVGVGLLIIKNNRVYLLHRTKTPEFKGLWSFPGGTLESGESIAQACIREAKEELLLDINKDSLKFLKSSHIKSAEKSPYLMFVFLVENINQEPFNNEPEKHHDARWFDINKLPEDTMDYTKEIIKDYLNPGLQYSEIGWD